MVPANLASCYNNCPNDEAVDTAKGQQQIFCGYASQYPSSTPAAAKKTGTTATTATKATGTNTASGSDNTGSATSGTAAGTATAATETNSGADLAFKSGSMLFAVAGMVAALL